MAKMNESGKWKKRWAVGLSLSMAAVLSLGIFSACKTTDDSDGDTDEEEAAAMPTDTQLLKNGNFEFYSEMTSDEDELTAILNTPTSWSFSSGSPSSDTKSGLIDLKYWESIAKSKYTYGSVADAYANWDKGSIYDKLEFFYKCDNSSNNSEYDAFEDAYDALSSGSAEKKFFNEHSFSSVDFEDVQYLWDELGEKDGETENRIVPLHDDTDEEKKDERGVLMIHNRRTSDGAVGTAQSYSSSTTITLPAGSAAKISVWVKTAQLRHYYADAKEESSSLDGLKVNGGAGAYVGVTQTVGGTTLDQMQIKNINTEVTNPDNANNGWEQYTVYVRANTFATTTVKLVLGLGQGSSDDRYETVNGYALFDDVTCELMKSEAYSEATKENKVAENYSCNIDSEKDKKLFDATKLSKNNDGDGDGTNDNTVFAIDLYAGSNSEFAKDVLKDVSFGLTEETSGSAVYNSERIDSSLCDNSKTGDEATRNIADVLSLDEITSTEQKNGYLKSIAANDFKNYPFATDANKSDENIILLLSANGAAYTAKSQTLTLAKDAEPLLISFFVKTSAVINGRTGATISLVEAYSEKKTTISAFDSTTVATVDIDDKTTDIYDGWVQCFFFVSNDTDEDRSFTLEFSLGPTSIADSDKYDYGQGYAAFVNFETKTLTKTELSYASTGDRAVKVSLTGSVEDSTVFDEADKVKDIEKELATPISFEGVLAGSNRLDPAGADNAVPSGVLTGLLNYNYAKTYAETYKEVDLLKGLGADNAWSSLFGDKENSYNTALQPLVIINTDTENAKPSYGYFASSATLSANSYQKISLRVKLSAGAKATVYLTDVSEFSNTDYNTFLKAGAPSVTYWYDEEGNICNGDPDEKETEILFELQTNGLYRNAKDKNDTAYYANLKNYKEKDGNLVLGNGSTIAFYGHDNKHYAYRTENSDGSYTYSTEVKDLYDLCKDYARYDYIKNNLSEAKITVENKDTENATDWVTVAFFVHTGNESKNYRLEIWAGDRENTTDGIPKGGYVFFDRYSSSSISNYETLRDDAVAELEEKLKDELEDNGNLPASVAQYYTFTFYDSANYLRYDVNEDTDNVGNLYANYDQSAYSEEIIYLEHKEYDAESDALTAVRSFISYAASDVTVEPETPAEDDDTTTDDTEKEPISTGDILLIVSSALLGVVLLFVIVMLLVRRFAGKRKKANKAAAVQDKRYKPSKKEEPEADEEEENPFVKNRKAKEAAEKAKANEEASADEPEAESPSGEAPAEEPSEPNDEE